MKEELRFNWLDILRAPRVAFSVQKIWIQLVLLLPAYLVYLGLSALALGSAEGPFARAWERVGIYGCPFMAGEAFAPTWYGWVLWAVGFLVLLVGFLLSAMGVARATYLQLKGETFFTWTEIYKFVFKHWKSVVTSPVGLLVFIFFYAVAGACVGAIGRIPYIGPLWIGGLSFMWIWCAVFLLFLFIAFLFSVLLAPAVIATTRGDFFEVITETFSCAFNEPWRLVLYELTIGVLVWLCAGLFRIFLMGSYKLLGLVFAASSFIGGTDVGWMWQKSTWIVDGAVPRTFFWQRILGAPLGINLPVMDVVRGASPAGQPAGFAGFCAYLLGITTLLFVFIAACYATSILVSGNTLLYIVLRKRKDDENLLEIEEEEEEEEEIAPPAEEGAEVKPEEEAPAEEVPAEGRPEEGGEAPEAGPAEETPEEAPAEGPAEGAGGEAGGEGERPPEGGSQPSEGGG